MHTHMGVQGFIRKEDDEACKEKLNAVLIFCSIYALMGAVTPAMYKCHKFMSFLEKAVGISGRNQASFIIDHEI